MVVQRVSLSSKDIDAIVDLYRVLSPQREFKVDNLARAAQNPHFVLFQQFDPPNRYLIGTASFSWIIWASGKVKGYIEDVVVHPDYRYHGIGSTLLQRIIDYAKEVGCTSIDLCSNDTRQEAHGLYRKFGFEIADTNLFRLRLES